MVQDRNCLSYWYPKLVAAGLPVPRTEIVRTPIYLGDIIDGKEPEPVCVNGRTENYTSFMYELSQAAERISQDGPVFLRTGQTSDKHRWNDTCFLSDRSKIQQHVFKLVEASVSADLPSDVWCVREMLPVYPVGFLPTYGNMPLVREVRCFVEAGEVVCSHPYWPLKSIEKGIRHLVDHAELANFYFDKLAGGCGRLEVIDLQHRVATSFASDGAWSVDLIETDNGWCVTDMAEAGRSFHYEGCANGNRNRKWSAV